MESDNLIYNEPLEAQSLPVRTQLASRSMSSVVTPAYFHLRC
jgi:hypothetical protein